MADYTYTCPNCKGHLFHGPLSRGRVVGHKLPDGTIRPELVGQEWTYLCDGCGQRLSLAELVREDVRA